MRKIARNIKHLRTIQKWSQEQLAARLDIPRARIGSYEEGRCDPPIDTLVNMSNLFHVAIDAMVKCDLTKLDRHTFAKAGDNRILFPIVVDQDNQDAIEVVTVKASAGYLQGYADPDYIEKLPLMNLPFATQGKLRAFPIMGDSMPPLKPGSYVIGQYVESLSQWRDGTTGIVITKDEGIVYKRIYRKPKKLELHSDNTLYAPYSISMSEVVEVWRFVCSLQTTDQKDEEINLSHIMASMQIMQRDIQGLKKQMS
ncbi:MAG TPA: XRE family transcriptional regulator [Chitinophagaceae bacterium]|nr:XRE family transcriptional regulator [Chitinophagaceae bacterium]